MSSHAGPYAVSGALPIVAVIAISAIVALWIAAWLIRDVARVALQNSSQAEIPRVLLALGSLLDQLRQFLPWQSVGRRSITPEVPRDELAAHTKDTEDPSEGESQ